MLDEVAEDAPVHAADLPVEVDADSRHGTVILPHGHRRSHVKADAFTQPPPLPRGAALGATALSIGHAPRSAQAKPTITYWNGLTGADGKIMDELIDQFTRETGIRMEQQRIVWADLYAKLQVAVPADEGPDLALIHTVEVPHFASDGILEPMADSATSGKGFKAEDYLPSTWQGGMYQG
jgi:multiple sugar transport system substrate-binding protein